MWWGGLRGAVGFALATVLSEDLWYREIFVTTALVKVLFTVFLQGSTIKLMVEKLKISLQSPREVAIGVEIQNKVIEETKKGVLAICGNTTSAGAKRGYLASKWNLVDEKVKENQAYEYRVRALNEAGPSDPSMPTKPIPARPVKGKCLHDLCYTLCYLRK